MFISAITVSDSVVPEWLIVVAWISLAAGVVCSAYIVQDVIRRPQPMKVMNVVWPICALFGSVIWLAAYLWWGRAELPGADAAHSATPGPETSGAATTATPDSDTAGRAVPAMAGMDMSAGAGSGMSMPAMGPAGAADPTRMHMAGMGRPALGMSGKPHTMPVSVFCGTSHCGAGCSLADLIVEWTLFALPSLAVIGGLNWLFPDSISAAALYAGWVIAYFVALATGITFQYFAIAPMNPQRTRLGNVAAAAKADVLSLSAWQIGMYGVMAIAQLAVFPAWFGGQITVASPVFWLTMQIAMLAGFCTAYPVNWWLIHAGIKERM